jgi:ribosomal-protein-alanine N-acetyltransferase
VILFNIKNNIQECSIFIFQPMKDSNFMKIHLETARFIIRNLELTDVNGMFELDADPEVHKYLGNKPISTLKEAKETINFVRQQYITNGIGRWAIVDKSTNEFIGWTGLKLEDKLRFNTKYYDLGYRLIQKHWGKGIATETAIASLNYGFEKLDLKEICACADVNNLASNKILSKIGLNYIETFTFEDTPVNWYKLTKEEWFELKK